MNYSDKSKALTAEDLIRRYDLENLKAMKKVVKNINNILENQYTIIKQYIRNVTLYTNQVDSTAWFFNGVPTLQNEPYTLFAQEELSSRVNNLYYNKATGKIYIFTYSNSEYSWEEVSDDELAISLSIANSEADTQDNRRNIFYQTPSVPYEVGDIWINDNIIMRCRCSREAGSYSENDWIEQEYYSESNVLLDVKAVLNQFEETVTNDYATKALLETTKESILSQVSSTITKTTTDLNNAIEEVSQTYESQLEQTSSGFTASLDNVRSIINSNNDATNSRIDNIHNYLNYQLEIIDGQEVGVVTLGASNSDVKLKLVNNIVYFEQNGNRVAYISNNKLYITDAEFLNSIQIGNFAFIPRSNGSLGFRKVI